MAESVQGLATTRQFGFRTSVGQEIFSSPHPCRPALGPTQASPTMGSAVTPCE
jgi:hypothetical protein